jgi:DNA polymerase-3 subunit epsilon
MMLDYTAIDFETANSYRGSPCAVGLVRVRNGVAVDELHCLIRPPERVEHFDYWNSAIHGITKEMVADQPRWKDVLPAIIDYIGDDVVVAHNAGFDIGVIRYACAVDNIEWPELRFLCTMVLARRALSLPTYRLPFVVEALGGSINDHHDPLADARAVVDLLHRLAANGRANGDLGELAKSVGVNIGHMRSGIYRGCVAISPGSSSRLVQPDLDPNADPNGYLYGRVVVFTGTLLSMTRHIAWTECARVGAIAEPNTTKRTNVLVVGDINPAVLRPGSTVTGRTRRAFDLQDQGQEIEVMTEDDFLRCLDGKPLDRIAVLLSPDNQDQTAPRKPTPAPLRKVSIADRPKPKTPKPRKPLRRQPVSTKQACSTANCTNMAAFQTRTKPAWCTMHIIELQCQGGLFPLESFTHPDDWQLTECRTCRVQAHYRFQYTVEKNRSAERTCRACYWRQWAAECRATQGPHANVTPVSYEKAKELAEEHGYEYLGPLTAPSLNDDPHHVRCCGCGRISAERLGDISFGCSTCKPRG